MASIGINKSGTKCIRFFDQNGDRKTLHIGKVDKRTARLILVHVERLASAAKSRCSVPDETSNWVGSLGDEMRSKMARVGLIAARESVSLRLYIEQYIERRKDVKSNTLISWRRTLRYLLLKFDGSRQLQTFTKADCKDFRQCMVALGYAEATIRRTCGVARQFFEGARERGLIADNPFKVKDVPVASIANPDRQEYVTREAIEAVIAACPDVQWRLLVALSRYGGLRCPSEHLGLLWDGVNWEAGRMVVYSPKTEHHPGGAMRTVPIFSELMPYLREAYDLRGDSQYVISRYRNTNANLRTEFLRIIKRAGVTPWAKLFHALRASCETDLAGMYPIHTVCRWLGNSVAVAAKHYLSVKDDDFDRASGRCQNPGQSVAETSGQHRPAISRSMVNHWKPSVSPSRRVGVTGIEPVTPSV